MSASEGRGRESVEKGVEEEEEETEPVEAAERAKW